MHSPFTGLWKNRDFVKLWTAQTVSKLGNGVTGIALPLTAVLVLNATPAQMGILSALEGIAVLLVGLFAGVWVDRLRRRPVLIATDLGRAALLLWVPLAAFFGLLHIEQLYLVVALVGVLTVFFQSADHAFLPTLVRQEELVEGNSKLGASDSIAEIGGLSLAGLLVQFVTAPLAILFDVGSFLFSAWCVGRIRAAEPPPKRARAQPFWHELVEGIQVIAGHPVLRVLAGSAFLLAFFGNFFAALYSLYVVREIGASPAILGFLIAAGGIGALGGAFFEQRVVQRFGIGKALGGAQMIAGVFGLLTPLAAGPLIVAVSLLFISQLAGDLFYAISQMSEISLRQTIIPASLLGRTNASMQVLTRGLGAGGALVAGILGQQIGTRPTLLVATLGFILASCWLLCSPVRKAK
jgi:Na+/melibiose symporter-like transporter